MPLGSPEGPTQTQWKITADSVARVGDYPVTFNVTATTDNPDAAAVPDIVQTFVDLLASSPDFRFASAARTYAYSEPMTPTV
ncbi:hypothetical protein ACFWOX_34145 [Streptomyces sp. NPDC058467]|uniref:hypothetical protein n=1 Tax=Streptomyces sp. NPDC058467 TaxID=3346513 RepID=UPI0036634816